MPDELGPTGRVGAASRRPEDSRPPRSTTTPAWTWPRSIARGLGRQDTEPLVAQRHRPHGRRATLAGRPGRAIAAGPTRTTATRRRWTTTLGRFVSEQGWETELRVHGVFSRWEAIVGRDVGQHVTPESYADGRLVVRTDSTAWATQMKLLAPDVVRRLNEVLGDGTVQVIDVEGPRGPSWKRGRLRVKGRGPRDTYG